MKRVVVGMSGGVDSSVAAYLLKKQGYEVFGVTMQMWQDDGQAVADAKKVADTLGIPHYVMDFKARFREDVINDFISEYQNGHTPNPCIVCNRCVKWEALLNRCGEFGAEYVATGHYARIDRLQNGRYTVKNSVAAQKDQTYALCRLTQEQLAHTLMPVGEYEKSEVREIAAKIGLDVAKKKDSQDICFVPDGDYASFIIRETGHEFSKGNFVDEEGNILGIHNGIIHYTIGQRKGLGVVDATPWFVKEIRPKTNEVVLCKSDNLFSRSCLIENVNYMGIESIEGPYRTFGKVRYAHRGDNCVLEPYKEGVLKCTFDVPQRAVTPGQYAVFYEDGHVLCGGRIIGSVTE